MNQLQWVTLAVLIASCQTVKFWEKSSDAPKAESPQFEPVSDLSPEKAADELTLKQAKLWSRVDELEETVLQMRSRIKVLEKGLMLGMVPEELKNEWEGGASSKSKKNVQHKKQKADTDDGSEDKKTLVMPAKEKADSPARPNDVVNEAQSEEDKANERRYQEALSAAQENYRAGRFGRAIADYSAIAREYPDKASDGSYKYWIAMSWNGLRELQTSRQSFLEFVEQHPKNAWIPNAMVQLAKIELQLGMQAEALTKLQTVLRDFANSDAAEMARAELNRMEKTL